MNTAISSLLKVMTTLLAIAGIVVGSANLLGGLVGFAEFSDSGSLGSIEQAAGYAVIDNSSRFLGGIFLGVGLGFLYCLFDLRNKLPLFHILLLAIFIGGIGRMVGWAELGEITAGTIAPTVIELVFPPIMIALARFTPSSENRQSEPAT